MLALWCGIETHYKQTAPKVLNPLQRLSVYLAQIMCLLAVAFICIWAANTNTSKKYLGGLGTESSWDDDTELLFNWHPVSMVLAFTFGSTQAVLSYRYTFLHRLFGKFGQKAVHLMWHTVTMGFLLFGLYATIEWHYIEDEPDLYSLHSWLGVTTTALFSAQYFVGIWNFWFPGAKVETRRAYHPMHVFFGIFIYFLANFTILTGITQKNYDIECWYTMSTHKKDYNPALYYDRIPAGCKFSNGAGVAIFLTMMFTSYAAMDMRATIVRKSARRSSFLDIE